MAEDQRDQAPVPTKIFILNEGIPLAFTGKNRSGMENPVLLEDDDTLRIWGVAVGLNPSDVENAFRLNANNELIVESRRQHQLVDPVTVPNVEGILYNPGTVATQVYEVRFTPVGNTTADVLLTMGVDIAAGGALTVGEYFFLNLTVHGNTVMPEFGPYYIGGDDDIRGSCSVDTAVTVHWNIVRVA